MTLLACFVGGCVPPPLCPARWGHSWCRQTSPHYVLLSDLSEREAKQRLEQFEAVYQSLETLAFRSEHQQPRDRLQVVLFRSSGDYESVVSTTTAGQFHHNELDPDDAPYIVMFGDLDNDTLEAISPRKPPAWLRAERSLGDVWPDPSSGWQEPSATSTGPASPVWKRPALMAEERNQELGQAQGMMERLAVCQRRVGRF